MKGSVCPGTASNAGPLGKNGAGNIEIIPEQ